MPDPDRATAHRQAFNARARDAIDHARLWCRAKDVAPAEKAEAVRRLIVCLEDVVRVEVEW